MATGTRAKAASGKKGKYKKPAKQKGKKRKGKAGVAIVGVISSISVTTALKNAIVKGGNFTAQQLSINGGLGYDQATLQGAISLFNNDANIELIITVGGGITYAAAAAMAALAKPFVSVVGEEPPDPAPQCYGGVTLRSCQADAKRIGKTLHDKGFQPAEIGLYYNPKSVMATAENLSWPGGQVIAATVPNDEANYPGDLAQFSAGIKAIVISADPFFQDTKDALTAAVNNTNKYCCYSVQDFNGKHLKASMHGPKLKEVYSLIGTLAANVLTNGFASGFMSSKDYVNDA
jgi:hypothetical protein